MVSGASSSHAPSEATAACVIDDRASESSWLPGNAEQMAQFGAASSILLSVGQLADPAHPNRAALAAGKHLSQLNSTSRPLTPPAFSERNTSLVPMPCLGRHAPTELDTVSFHTSTTAAYARTPDPLAPNFVGTIKSNWRQSPSCPLGQGFASTMQGDVYLLGGNRVGPEGRTWSIADATRCPWPPVMPGNRVSGYIEQSATFGQGRAPQAVRWWVDGHGSARAAASSARSQVVSQVVTGRSQGSRANTR